MATFPNLRPAGRSWTMGDWAQRQNVSLDGSDYRMRYGDQPTGDSLSLTFPNLRESAVIQLVDHYRGQFGSHLPFALSAGVIAGMSSDFITPAGQSWRYASAPSVRWVRPGVANVTLSLITSFA